MTLSAARSMPSYVNKSFDIITAALWNSTVIVKFVVQNQFALNINLPHEIQNHYDSI
jgi:hypothetical protein